jgi:hypothetical protein
VVPDEPLGQGDDERGTDSIGMHDGGQANETVPGSSVLESQSYDSERGVPITGFPQVPFADRVPALPYETVGLLGLLAFLARPVFTTSRIAAFSDVRLAVRQLWGVLLPRRKRIIEPWGTVYDSHTKHPLDPAYVSLRDARTKKEVAGVVTDLAGRYGFHVVPGDYYVVASKTHYVFPSGELAGRSSDIVYDNLYFGEQITVPGSGSVIVRNVPMDALGLDWNEEEKIRLGLVSARKRRQYIRFILNVLFAIGALYSTYVWALIPNVWNTVVLVGYVIIFGITMFYKRHATLASVKESDGTPLSYARIKLFFTTQDVLAKEVVADADGQFYLLVPPGTYRLVVEERNRDGTYTPRIMNKELRLPKGIVTGNYVVN